MKFNQVLSVILSTPIQSVICKKLNSSKSSIMSLIPAIAAAYQDSMRDRVNADRARESARIRELQEMERERERDKEREKYKEREREKERERKEEKRQEVEYLIRRQEREMQERDRHERARYENEKRTANSKYY